MPNSGQPAPRLLDRVREALRLAHYSDRTEEAYVGWIRRFILFHRKRHPDQMGAAEVRAFLAAPWASGVRPIGSDGAAPN
jgi:Arc/MetJ-type ribon-helix-helix transcriptional regulator